MKSRVEITAYDFKRLYRTRPTFFIEVSRTEYIKSWRRIFILHTVSRLLDTHSITFFRKSDTHVVVDIVSVVRVTVFTQTRRQESAVLMIMNGNITRAGLRKRKKASLQEIFALKYKQKVRLPIHLKLWIISSNSLNLQKPATWSHHYNRTQLETVNTYEGHIESKERFAIKKYLLIIGKKENMQVLSHTFTYFST